MVYIQVDDVYRTFRTYNVEVQALRGLHLEVDEGEMVAIVGPSGAGKTTLLNLIGGLDQPTAGRIHVGPHDVASLTPKDLVTYRRTMIGHIFQTINLVPTFSAAENIALPLIFAGTPRTARQQRVDTLLDLIQLTARRHHTPDELSGGEQQRVAIAAALATDPPILLADEPTGDLDTDTSLAIVDILTNLYHRAHKTILLVTHNPLVAAACPHILRIADGQIQGRYTPAQLASPTPLRYLDRLRTRVQEFDTALQHLDQQFHAGTITGDHYATQRTKLLAAKQAFLDEIYRYGT